MKGRAKVVTTGQKTLICRSRFNMTISDFHMVRVSLWNPWLQRNTVLAPRQSKPKPRRRSHSDNRHSISIWRTNISAGSSQRTLSSECGEFESTCRRKPLKEIWNGSCSFLLISSEWQIWIFYRLSSATSTDHCDLQFSIVTGARKIFNHLRNPCMQSSKILFVRVDYPLDTWVGTKWRPRKLFVHRDWFSTPSSKTPRKRKHVESTGSS